MLSELSLAQLMGLVVGAILAHVAMFVASRKINPLFMLAGVILLLAPFSAAPELALGVMIKWVRGYALIMLLVIGFFKFRSGLLRPVSQVWLLFVALYVLSGVYSTLPHAALSYKAQFGLVALAGIFLAYGVRDQKELIRGLRFLGVAAGILAFIVLGHLVMHPTSFVVFGRVNILGVFPTRIAGNLAALVLICTYLALNERSGFWKTIASFSCGLLAIVIAVTGSRGPASVVVMGFLIQLLPQSGRRLRMLMLPVFVVGVGLLVLDMAGNQLTVERLISTEDTRTGVWGRTVDTIMERPLLGYGWLYDRLEGGGVSGANAHNLYLQVAVDMGLLGLAFFGVCLLVVAYGTVQMYGFLRRQRTLSRLAILPVSLIAATLLDGMVTTDGLSPSSIALMMAFGVGLVDRLPELALAQRRRALQIMEYARLRRPLPGRPGFGGLEVPR